MRNGINIGDVVKYEGDDIAKKASAGILIRWTPPRYEKGNMGVVTEATTVRINLFHDIRSILMSQTQLSSDVYELIKYNVRLIYAGGRTHQEEFFYSFELEKV